MDPVDRTRELLPGNGDLCSQQDRKMGFCEFNQIRRRLLKTKPPEGVVFVFGRVWAIPTGAQSPFAYAALPRRRHARVFPLTYNMMHPVMFCFGAKR